jgi:sulfate/thiosulfate-binding protein
MLNPANSTDVSRWRTIALALVVAVVAACHGGPSDVVGGGGPAHARTTITVIAYSAAEPGWSKVIPAFNASPEGKDVQVVASYGASADQSRAVVTGKPADLVNLSLEPDMARLVKAGKVPKDWDKDATKGIPFGSVVAFVVRQGNPKNIKDWGDLLRPDVQVVTPSPLSSGSAKWNLLAPYAAKSDGGRNPQAGLDFVNQLVSQHVKLRPGSAREATDVFVEGSGDVLLSSENEAIVTERQGRPVTHIVPTQTVKIENPLAVTTTSGNVAAATAFKNFQYTEQAQRLWAAAGFRPVDPAVAAEVRDQFPVPAKLWTITDLGGWDAVDSQLFDPKTGGITGIYLRANG